MLILIVDDDEDLLFSLSKTLAHQGLEVRTAATFEKAMMLLDADEFEAIITDLNLTRNGTLEGLEIIEHAKTNQKQCKIIVITAIETGDVKKESFERGADVYLEKPVSSVKIRELFTSMGIG